MPDAPVGSQLWPLQCCPPLACTALGPCSLLGDFLLGLWLGLWLSLSWTFWFPVQILPSLVHLSFAKVAGEQRYANRKEVGSLVKLLLPLSDTALFFGKFYLKDSGCYMLLGGEKKT